MRRDAAVTRGVTPDNQTTRGRGGVTLSVLILTLNEEVDLDACLACVVWCDDVVVLDSFSTDRTVEIAHARGARVIRRKFDTYAGQRNFGLKDVEYRHPWVLMLDADERVPPDLRAELEGFVVANAATDVTLASMRRRDFLFGRWIRRSSGYPTWFGRLARIGRVWIERAVNEEYCTNGRTVLLEHHLDHYPFSKGFSHWLAKHDRYSTLEAELLLETDRSWTFAELRATDPSVRRRALKALVYSLPARPLIVFVALYVVKGGFLEGRAGLTFCLLRAWYEFLIDCKRRELVRRRERLPI
jgi:glycosyltransferase involved in cell wall biosynthesis